MFHVNANLSFEKGVSVDFSEKWNFPADETVYSLVVENNLLYFTTGDKEGYPSTLYCLDVNTGNQVWKYSAAYIYFTISNDRIYIRQSVLYNPLSEGFLVCLDAFSGVELWKSDLNRQVNSMYVALDSNWLFVTAHSKVFALDATNGDIKWEYSAPKDTFFSVFACETYVGEFIISGNEQTDGSYSIKLYMFHATSGQKIWSEILSNRGGSLFSTASNNITDDKVLVSYTVSRADDGFCNLASLDAQNGTILWKYTPHGKTCSFAVADEIVYCSGSSGSVAAVNATTGDVIWNYNDNSHFGSVTIADKYLYVSSTTGVSCFSTVDGAKIWGYQASDYNADPTHGSLIADLSPTNPAFADGIVYFGWNGPQGWLDTTEHNFYALNSHTGAVLWKTSFSYSIIAAPVVVNNTLYLGCSGVTQRSPTWVGVGTVKALNLSYTSISNDTASIILVAGILVISLVAVIFVIRKRRNMNKKGYATTSCSRFCFTASLSSIAIRLPMYMFSPYRK